MEISNSTVDFFVSYLDCCDIYRILLSLGNFYLIANYQTVDNITLNISANAAINIIATNYDFGTGYVTPPAAYATSRLNLLQPV